MILVSGFTVIDAVAAGTSHIYALCSDRPYRPGWPREKVLEYIVALKGIHFDPKVVDVFMQLIRDLVNPLDGC